MNGQQRIGMFSALAGLAILLGAMVGPMRVQAGDDHDDRPLSGTIVSHNTGDDAECDSTEWHWVITGLKGHELELSDAPSHIHVAWSNGTNTRIDIQKMTGGVAHYVTTAHLRDGVTPTSAMATWPSGTHVTRYNQFNLSHGPCTEPPVTDPPVTDPPVTDPPVTDPPVTDPPVTDPPDTTIKTTTTTTTTTTTAPPTTGATTTSVDSESPEPPETTVAIAGPVPPTTGELGDGGALPTTGGGADRRLLALGGVLLGVGLTMTALARRPSN